MLKRYSEMILLPTIIERYEYLKLNGRVGSETFGFDRYLNQKFYKSKEWQNIRDAVILRDSACDLAMPDEDYSIVGRIIVHHMNPIAPEDIQKKLSDVLNPEFLVCVSHSTHQAIHYGDRSLLPKIAFEERHPGDTCLWS